MKANIFNKKASFLLILTVVLLGACKKDFLDQKTLSSVDETAVYQDSVRSLGVVNQLYSNMGLSFNQRRFSNTGLDAACDESEPANDPVNHTLRISSGAINPSNADKVLWTTAFQMIRTANIFLKNKSSIPVTEETRNYWEGQVRFLRAWYIHMLLKHFGGVPLIGDNIYSDNDKIDVPRSSYEACFNYIKEQYDIAALYLPESYTFGDINEKRLTKGSVLAAKARLLLYAASPLTNSGPRSDDPNRLLTFPSASNERWKEAADAARAVIELNVHSLYNSAPNPFYNLFLQQTMIPEYVLAYWPTGSTAMAFYVENTSNPQSRTSVNSYVAPKHFPTQELVDEFDMINGLRITDPASGYAGIGDNMYKNRDPRLTFTVHYNGAIRNFGSLGDQPVNTYTGIVPSGGTAAVTSASVDGMYTSTGTKTGYFRYKSCSNFAVSGGVGIIRAWVLIRYAEILLNAAEATNEYSGPSAEVYDWLKAIRGRAGIQAGANNMYGLKENMTKEEMREAIWHERRVELAFEEHRFWDIRRWKIAPETENRETHGMEITRSATGTFSYRKVVVRKHVFTDAMYFWPIPQSERVKSPSLEQNPGY